MLSIRYQEDQRGLYNGVLLHMLLIAYFTPDLEVSSISVSLGSLNRRAWIYVACYYTSKVRYFWLMLFTPLERNKVLTCFDPIKLLIYCH